MSSQISFKRRYLAVVLAAVAGVVAMWLTHKPAKRYHTDQGSVWTTEYHITYESVRPLSDSIAAVLGRMDASASMFNDSSLLSRVNRNEAAELDDILLLLYTTSRQVNAESDGAFDPTVRPLVEAWGFGRKTGACPTPSAIDSLLEIVGIGKTRLQGRALVKSDPRVQFDFSSIAKGLACDEVGRMLARNGATNFLVEIGGEVMARGVNERGEQWHVSVDMPSPDEHASALVVAADSCAVATSGSYRRYRQIDGEQRVSHIVNPATGQSTVSNLLSVTIIARDCMTADAWATACMVLGDERVRQLMEHRTDLGVMTITTDAEDRLVAWSNARFADCVIP